MHDATPMPMLSHIQDMLMVVCIPWQVHCLLINYICKQYIGYCHENKNFVSPICSALFCKAAQGKWVCRSCKQCFWCKAWPSCMLLHTRRMCYKSRVKCFSIMSSTCTVAGPKSCVHPLCSCFLNASMCVLMSITQCASQPIGCCAPGLLHTITITLAA